MTYRKVSLLPTTVATCWGFVTLIQYTQAQIVMSGYDDTRRVAGNGCIVQQPVACCVPTDLMRNGKKPINLSTIYVLDSPDDPSSAEDP